MGRDSTTNRTDATTTPLDVTIDAESDGAHGWVYQVRVMWKGNGESLHEVHLAWVDHDALCGGAHPPSDVARRAAMIAAEFLGHDRLPRRFDVSTLRRLVPGFERLVTPSIG